MTRNNKIVICVPVYDTEENGRTKYTKQTFESLFDTVNINSSFIVFIDNGSCRETKKLLENVIQNYAFVITNENNVGTAEAINQAIHEHSKLGDFIVKMDNDVVVHQDYWADEMRACIESDPSIGVLGLKRKDLPNSPGNEQYPTDLQFANREHGSEWRVIEECDDIIGTCHMYNPEFMKKAGGLYQPGLYAFDDVLMCVRSKVAGFKNAFYPSIEIDHVDEGGTEYTEWKKRYAGTQFGEINDLIEGYQSGAKSIYYNPFGSEEIEL